MIAALTALERTFQIVVLGPPTAPDPLPDLGDLLIRDDSALPLPVWVQCKLPLICRQQEIDLLWCPGNMGPLAVPNQLLTIHDASPFANPRWFSRLFGLYTRASWPLLARRVRRVVTDSKFSRSELQRFGITT